MSKPLVSRSATNGLASWPYVARMSGRPNPSSRITKMSGLAGVPTDDAGCGPEGKAVELPKTGSVTSTSRMTVTALNPLRIADHGTTLPPVLAPRRSIKSRNAIAPAARSHTDSSPARRTKKPASPRRVPRSACRVSRRPATESAAVTTTATISARMPAWRAIPSSAIWLMTTATPKGTGYQLGRSPANRAAIPRRFAPLTAATP